MELQRQQFFHASKRHHLEPGKDQILPANDPLVGGSHYGYSHHDNDRMGWADEPDRGDFTFAADTEEEAEAWTPGALGRPVTYVVEPAEGVETEAETHHYVTNSYDDSKPPGEHLKARGPLNIIDRIDIPRPNPEAAEESVQGTFGGLNWGQFNKVPEGSKASMGMQYPESDNFQRMNPPLARMRAENDANTEIAKAKTEQIRYRNVWSRAGQQELF